MLRKSIAFACSALFLLAVATSTVLADIPETDAEHSNYGDTAKAKEFAKEHMGEKGKNLTEKEELMMLFTLHDTNKDGHLDGIELRAAFSDYNDQHTPNSQSTVTLQQMLDMIDHVIGEDDINNDGKISLEEYMISQKYHEG
ncbi:hypothetical protein EC957_000941 [Mortierella hygrophila]|uniref:EF-hand domain-containing protein n=1 Tax=Mortierella hygrophila TaxID=979708 RepID=A0A9P6F5D9_9FUNG|nr:hypothetical protein EC957_000941 [Mortierella hygrophila]